MNRNDLITAAIAAGASLTLSLAVFWPVDLQAGGPGSKAAKIRQPLTPTLTVDGSRIELLSKPGSRVLVLKLINPTSKTLKLMADVRLTSQAPSFAVSRRMPMPTTLWQKRLPLELAPGKTRILRIPTKVKAAKGRQFVFSVRIGKKTIRSQNVLLFQVVRNGAPVNFINSWRPRR